MEQVMEQVETFQQQTTEDAAEGAEKNRKEKKDDDNPPLLSNPLFSLDAPHDNDSNSKSRHSNGASEFGRQSIASSRMEALMRRVSKKPDSSPQKSLLLSSPSLDSSTDTPLSPNNPIPPSMETNQSDNDEDITKAKRSKRNFTKQEDDIIAHTIGQYGEGPDVWQNICELLGDRTVAQVKSRFKRFSKKMSLSSPVLPLSPTPLNYSMEILDENLIKGSSHPSTPNEAIADKSPFSVPNEVLLPPYASSEMDVDIVATDTIKGVGLVRNGGENQQLGSNGPLMASATSLQATNVVVPSSPSSLNVVGIGKGKRGASAMMSSFLASANPSIPSNPSNPTPASSVGQSHGSVSAPSTPTKAKRAKSRVSTPTSTNASGIVNHPSKGHAIAAVQGVASGIGVTAVQGEEFEPPSAKRPKSAVGWSSTPSSALESSLSTPSGAFEGKLSVLSSAVGPVGANLKESLPRPIPALSTSSSALNKSASTGASTSTASVVSGTPLSGHNSNIGFTPSVSIPGGSASPSGVKVLGSGVKMATREGGNFGTKVKVSMTVEELQRHVDDAVSEALVEARVMYKKRDEEWQKRVEEEREKSLSISHEFSTKSRELLLARTQQLESYEAVQMHLRESLVDHEKLLRQVNREKLAEASARLGYPVYGRNGEEFREGVAGKKLREKERKIDEERVKLESMKKKLVKRKNSVAVAVSLGSSLGNSSSVVMGEGVESSMLFGEVGMEGGGGGFVVPTVPASSLMKAPEREMEEVMRQEQYVKMKLLALKGKEGEVVREKEILRVETQLHYKELRRHSEEEASIFSGYQILNGRYLMLRMLGRGGFSEVFKSFDLKQNRFVACKIHQLNINWPLEKKSSYMRHAERECEIHTSLIHDRIVSLFDVFEIDENTFCTVMEYCDGGDMDSYLKQQKALPEMEVKILSSQLFEGLKYLMSRENEKQKIIHYDLKPGNLLFDSEGNVKIADFGLSKIISDSDSDSIDLTSQGAGTYWYLPPECFDPEKPKITSKVDVWSAGVIIFQMLFGSKPFGHNISQKLILERNLIHPNLKLEFPASSPISGKKISDDAKSFLSLCLTPNVLQRPDANQLSSHPFISFHYGASSQRGMGEPSSSHRIIPPTPESSSAASLLQSPSPSLQSIQSIQPIQDNQQSIHHQMPPKSQPNHFFPPTASNPLSPSSPSQILHTSSPAVRVASLAILGSSSSATQATIGGGTFTLVKK